jgi:hypothetical protein
MTVVAIASKRAVEMGELDKDKAYAAVRCRFNELIAKFDKELLDRFYSFDTRKAGQIAEKIAAEASARLRASLLALGMPQALASCIQIKLHTRLRLLESHLRYKAQCEAREMARAAADEIKRAFVASGVGSWAMASLETLMPTLDYNRIVEQAAAECVDGAVIGFPKTSSDYDFLDDIPF